MSAEEPAVLHVHGPWTWHDGVSIVGNTAGLRLLWEAVQKAMEEGHAATDDLFVADGEGYELRVERDDTPWGDAGWQTRRLPYTDDVAAGTA